MIIKTVPKPHKNLPFSKPILTLQDQMEENAVPKAYWQQTAEERPDFTDRNVSIDRAGHTMPAQTFKQYIMDIVSLENTAHKRKEEMASICIQLGLSPDAWKAVYDKLQLKDAYVYIKNPNNIISNNPDYTPEKIAESIEIHINDHIDKLAQKEIDIERAKVQLDAFHTSQKMINNWREKLTQLKGKK